MEATYAKKTRSYINDNSKIHQIIDFSNVEIFKGVGAHTSILILEKNLDDINDIIKVVKAKELSLRPEKLINHINQKIRLNEYEDKYVQVFFKDQNDLKVGYWTLSLPKVQNLLDKLNKTKKTRKYY